jgi:hypothetical protein
MAEVKLDPAEVVQTVERLESELVDLGIRGLRAVGPQHLASLEALRDEFARIGADHLAGRIAALVQAIRADDRNAASLLRAQASLRVFERVLTLQTVGQMLQHADEPEAAE